MDYNVHYGINPAIIYNSLATDEVLLFHGIMPTLAEVFGHVWDMFVVMES